MKLKIPQKRARNALVPAALFKHAGRHGKTAGARRLQARRDLQKEVLQAAGNGQRMLPDRHPPSKWRTTEP